MPAKGLPTKEVFDILVDKKGFLWIGHNLGISRYDGITFTHFSHPMQSALGMTDLIEDQQGRIWCHNFSSQVFYIEKERMHLLKEYDYNRESTFPRMALLDNELVITSAHGLFVCNTETLQGRYLKVNNSDSSPTESLVLLKDKIVASGFNAWFQYDKEKGFVKIADACAPKVEMETYSYALSPASYKDTFYFIVNPKGWLYKIVDDDSILRTIHIDKQGSFINSVTVDQETIWINTTKRSATNNYKEILEELNISDHVTDHQGNHWISTLDKGLMVNFKTSTWKKSTFQLPGANDYMRHLAVYGNYFVGGTKNGQLIVIDKESNNIIWRHTFPASHAGIEYVNHIGAGQFLVSTSNKIFLFDIRSKEISLWAYFTARDADVLGDDLLIASPVGFYLVAPLNQKMDLVTWYRLWKKAFPSLDIGYHKSGILYKEIRSRAIRFNHLTKTIFISLKGELWEIGSFGMKPLKFNGQNINTSALEYFNDKMYIATFNGLLIKEKDSIHHLTTSDGLASNVIINMQVAGKYLWLFLNNTIQIFDPDNNKIIEHIDLPPIPGSDVYDVVHYNDTAYLTAEDGVYKVSLNHHPRQEFKTYLISVLVNNRDTLINDRFTLPYNSNNIQFNLAVPWYHPSHNFHFRYRLKGKNQNGAWYTTNEHEKTIRFAALMPGEYVFESYAVIAGSQEDSPLVIHFTIEKPWWKEWWFVLLIILSILSVLYAAYRIRLQQLLKVEKIRRNISSDLHDEIGSTLSSINIYSELAKKEQDNWEYLALIQNNVREVVTKLDDLVWSINPRNDSFRQLINRMQLFAEPLLINSNIHYSFEYDAEVLKLDLTVDVKQNLYLLFKEAINNVAKHSMATQCTATLRYKKRYVYLSIQDNGRGFTSAEYMKERNGLKNMEERAKQMNAIFRISSDPGKGTKIHLRVPVA